MPAEAVLFDLPSKGRCACWSLNSWKARVVLNYKGLPYSTRWIEYPDLAPTLKSFGIPPNTKEVNPGAEYSSPTVQLPDGTYVMDSLAIAHAIEKYQPEPSLRLNNDYASRAQDVMKKAMGPIAPFTIPRVPTELLRDASVEYFNRTRNVRFGMPLKELAKTASEDSWKRAEPGFAELKQLLHENPEGPYIQGKEPSFADFIATSAFRMAELLDHDGDIFGRIMKYDESFPKLYEACKRWYERDDH